jgi:hypothetical protein
MNNQLEWAKSFIKNYEKWINTISMEPIVVGIESELYRLAKAIVEDEQEQRG